MNEGLYVYFKFKNRKTGELNDGILELKDIEIKDPKMKKFFDIHNYKIVEKRLVREEDYKNWKRNMKKVV